MTIEKHATTRRAVSARRAITVGLLTVVLVLAGGVVTGTTATAPTAAETTAPGEDALAGQPAQQQNNTTQADNASQTAPGQTVQAGTAYFRVAHMSPDAPAVDVYVDGTQQYDDVDFGAIRYYKDVPAGDHRVTITEAGDEDAVVFNDTLTFEAGTAHTIAATGEVSEGANTTFQPSVLRDRTNPPAESAAVRLVHASPDAGPVDVTVGTGNNSTVLYDNVTFRQASQYVQVPGGEYTLAVRAATANNTGEVVETFDVAVENGTAYTAFAAGYASPDEAPSDEALDLYVREDGTVTNLRVAHMSPDAGPVDVSVDDETVLTDVPYQAVSEYLALTPTEHRITITQADNESAIVFDGNVTLEKSVYTLVAAGEVTPGATQPFEPLVLQENASDPDENTSRVRLAHVAPGVGPVDVTVEETNRTLYDGVTFGNATDAEVPAGEYTLEIREATPDDTGAVITTVDVDVEGGETYVAFATGYVTPEDTFEVVIVE